MNISFTIKTGDLHIWRVFFSRVISNIPYFLTKLSSDEIKRSQRFLFERDRERFIIGRGLLREMLGSYLKKNSNEIIFSYGAYGKPYLSLNPIYFNISHSHDIAVYVFSMNSSVGVDIEKIEKKFNIQVAKRFFSKEEYDYLTQLPDVYKNEMFYTIWSRKEAFIKATGRGLYASLKDFSCLFQESSERLIQNSFSEFSFYIGDFKIHPEYCSAFAVKPPIENIFFGEWNDDGPVAWR